MDIQPLTDSTDLLGDAQALKERWERDGVLFLRGVVDPDLVKWAEGKFREVLVGDGLIEPDVEPLVWTGVKPKAFRPCDALGTQVWHEFIKLPLLNDLMRTVLADEPVWIPIAGHRTSFPSGPIEPGADLFFGRHQDSYFSNGMHYIVCWMPLRDAALDAGNFTVAPGFHKDGNYYDTETHKMLVNSVPDDAWRAAHLKAGDLLVFDYYTPHATLPNPSDLIRISIDVRAVAASSPLPIIGTVEAVDGTEVSIHTDEGEHVKVRVSDETYIRDMLPFPRIPTDEVSRVAFPGARVMTTARKDGEAVMFRRNFY